MTSFFIQLSLIILIATLFGFIARLFKQPLILAYVLAGMILGPIGWGIVKESESLLVFSQVGVALLLFIVGISLNPKHLKEIGKISLVTGLGQVIFTSIFGFLIAKGLGYPSIEAVYISIALTFSSTIIIVKLLTDKNDLETLYGRIAIGFLLVQDFVAVLALVLISGLKPDTPLTDILMFTLLKGIILILGVWIIYKLLIKHLFSYISDNQELMFLSSITWCFLIAVVSIKLGFSLEIGAFLAGLVLASSEFGTDITAKIAPLRDFFIAIFFINLGIGMAITSLSQQIIPIILFSLFIIIGNPIIVLVIMGLLGYKSRTGFLAGLTVAQISEFSLILIALGVTIGHVSKEVSVMVTAVGIVTITASTYLILYGDKLYTIFKKPLSHFEKKIVKEKIQIKGLNKKYDIIILGCHRMGYSIIDRLKGKKILVIDFNPDIIKDLKSKNIDTIYADIGDSEIINEIIKLKPKIVVSTIPKIENNIYLIKLIKKMDKKTIVISSSYTAMDSMMLYGAGADFVIFPQYLAGHKVADYITHLNEKDIKKWGQHYKEKLIDEMRQNSLFM